MTENNGQIRKSDGTFAEGNPGKPKGAVTKVSVKVKEAIVAFVESNVDKIQDSFDSLEPKEKLDFISSLLSYTIPKLSAMQVEQKTEHSGGITLEIIDRADQVTSGADIQEES